MTVNPIIRHHLGSPWNQSFKFHDSVLQPISIEVLPKLNFDSTGLSRLLPVGTRIFIPHLSKTTVEEILGTVRGLKLAGFEPVPHIAARRIASHLELKRLLTALHGQEVHELLLVAGSNDTPVGEYKQCMDVLDSEIFAQFRFKRLLFAGHPGGHPNIGGKQINAALLRKIQKATQMGCKTAVVTQFCFNTQATGQWLYRLRNEGIDVPIYLGVTGPVSFKILLHYAAVCGVSISASQFIKRPLQMWPLFFNGDPGHFIDALMKQSGISGQIAGFHLFPFGGVIKTIQWAEQYASSERICLIENQEDLILKENEKSFSCGSAYNFNCRS